MGLRQDHAFSALKDPLSNPPTLAFPDFSLPFIVYVDASHDGVAACLHQPFIPSDDMPAFSQDSSSPSMVSVHPAFSFDFPDDELNALKHDLQNDRIFGHTYRQLSNGNSGAFDRFELVNGILYWRLRDGRLVTCIPESMVRKVLSAAHESFGHWGFEKTWSFVKQRFYRPA